MRPVPERSAGQARRKKPTEKPAPRRAVAPARPDAAPHQPVAEPEPPGQEPAPEPGPAPEPLPDAAAMVERLRRMREQRERNAPPPVAPARRAARPSAAIEPRFASGDTVFCMPWGNGEVKSSRVEGERELLIVHFVDHGDLLIDTAVSAVRLVRAAGAEDPGDDI